MLELHFSDIVNFQGEFTGHSERRNSSGFFIWSFKHPFTGNFIPYFVGYSETSIKEKIRKQITEINSINSTWMSLSRDYLYGENPFYSDSAFPMLTKKTLRYQAKPNVDRMPDWYEQYCWYFFDDKKFDYIHNKVFVANELFRLETETSSLKIELNNNNEIEILGQIEIPQKYDKQKRYPYRIIKEAHIEKGISWTYNLKDEVNNNLWVLYCSMDESFFEKDEYYNYCIYLSNKPFGIKPEMYKKKFFEVITSYIKYRLKGKTIGLGLPFHELFRHQKRLKLSLVCECKNIENYLFKNEISVDFNGYI